MAWQEQHKQQSRERILEAAAFLFARLGFNQVGIGDVMQQAGLTRGAFYAHFASKAELYTEALLFAGQQLEKICEEPGHNFENLVKLYLSENNLTEAGMACPLACLVSDVAHSDATVKKSYTLIFRGLVNNLQQLNRHKTPADILADAVLMIGAVAVARTLTDKQMARQILHTCQRRLLGD